MSVERRIEEWRRQSGSDLTDAERQFIEDMRKAAAARVGYGWMQQVIEWEWQSKDAHAWGPEYFNQRIDELNRLLRQAQDSV